MDNEVVGYLDFLRYSIGGGVYKPNCAKTISWQGLFRFGEEQSLLGVLFEGVKRLPEGTVQDVDLLMDWAMVAQDIWQENERVNRVAVELCKRLEKDGWRCCVLKGQGNTVNYPSAWSRNPGDIDVWMWPGEDMVSKSSYPYRADITKYVEREFGCGKVLFYHAEFEFDGVPAEAHFMPGLMNCPWYNARLQRWFKRNAALQGSNRVTLPGGVGEIPAPTMAFNLVYQLGHLYHHFFDEGVGLRQVIDYYLLLKTSDENTRGAVVHDIRHLGLYDFCGAVMWVLQEVFGLDETLMLCKPDARRGKVLLEEIVNGGNFGKFDKKYGGLSQQSMGHKYFTKIRRALGFVRLYPSEALCEPVFRTWHWVWRQTR